MEVLYIFRKPKFPLIIDFKFEVIGISKEKYLSQISFDKLKKDKSYNVIDSSGEGFSFGKKIRKQFIFRH